MIRVLLVDDSPEFVEEAERSLSSMPGVAFVGWSFSAADAIELLRRVDVDLVLLDLTMPGMDGLRATRQIKGCACAPRVIIISFNDDYAYRLAARHAGAEGFLSKADLFEGLAPLIQSLFGCPEVQ